VYSENLITSNILYLITIQQICFSLEFRIKIGLELLIPQTICLASKLQITNIFFETTKENKFYLKDVLQLKPATNIEINK
jgi:hypothetical protein